MTVQRVPGSFRDPRGFVYEQGGTIYRQVNNSYAKDYDAIVSAGLFDELTRADLLIPHIEVPKHDPSAYRTLKPERVEFISYPYEWCFSELKAAALCTLQIQRRSIEKGFTLRDASAFNIQFVNGKAKLIDTLSIERYVEGQPWIAYRQFCQHFLAPLLLVVHCDARLAQLVRRHIDGVPLDLASTILPKRTRLNLSVLMHITLHARAQQRYAAGPPTSHKKTPAMSKRSLLALIADLTHAVEKLDWKPGTTEWSHYYDDTNYTDAAVESKLKSVVSFIDKVKPKSVWDLGGNTGRYSRIPASQGIPTVCFDIDIAAVEYNYRTTVAKGETHILPLVMDLTNPSTDLGWGGVERSSLESRGPADLIMALALTHHLAIGNNVPFDAIADYFARLGRSLIIEFVPKKDSQVQRLLASREDIFDGYDMPSFERAFATWFNILERRPVEGSERTLYLMQRS